MKEKMKRLLGYFLQGLLYTLPIAATIYVVVEAIILIDGIIPVKFPACYFLYLEALKKLINFYFI